MKTIPLTQGRVALVDDADYEWLIQFRWYAKQGPYSFYAARNVPVTKDKRTTERMHRMILGLRRGDKQEVDHYDSDGLNNQRTNLRICTPVENQQSSRKRNVGTSRYKGVSWSRRDGKWRSIIHVNKKQKYLGLFDFEAEAARVYDREALKQFGKFALTNEMLGTMEGAPQQ